MKALVRLGRGAMCSPMVATKAKLELQQVLSASLIYDATLEYTFDVAFESIIYRMLLVLAL